MKIRFIITIALIGISFLKLSLVNAQGFKTSFIVNEREINIDSLETQIKFLMDEISIAGLSFAVVNQNDEVYYQTFGYKNLVEKEKQKNDKKTIFEACSLSKSFVVYAAHTLADQGVLDLDKPLYQYMEYEPLKHDERHKLITARMVLSHSSGLENHMNKNNPEVLDLLANPGERYIYSGEGYELLGLVMAKITNKPLDKFMRDIVYTPLQLERTFTTQEEADDNLALGHNILNEFVEQRRGRIELKSKILTTASDYAKLMIGLFGDKNLSDKRKKDLLDPIVRTDDSAELFYGAGYEVLYTPKDTILFQGGNNNVYKGLACYSMSKKCGFVFFANSDRSEKISVMLDKLTTGIDISPYFSNVYTNQYPSNANKIFNIYRNQGVVEMQKKLNHFLKNDEDSLTEKDVVELTYYFKDREYETIKSAVDKYLEKHPNSTIDFVYKRWLNK